MQTKVNGLIIAGTPEDMYQFVALFADANEAEPVKEEKKPAAKKQRKRIDWPKVEALKNAGWKNKEIAAEMGISEWSVSNHFGKVKK